MKEIVISIVAIIIISAAASYALHALNWSASGKYSSSSVRL
jgi:uncharacterized protein YxeA